MESTIIAMYFPEAAEAKDSEVWGVLAHAKNLYFSTEDKQHRTPLNEQVRCPPITWYADVVYLIHDLLNKDITYTSSTFPHIYRIYIWE